MIEYNENTIWGLDDLYKILVENKPVTGDALRIWQGIANSFYLGTRKDITGTYSSKIKRVFELASEYGVEVPIQKTKDTVQFINKSTQNLTEDEQRNNNIAEEFERIV